MSLEFFGVGGPGQIGTIKSSAKPSSDKKTEESQADKVEFSAVLQDVHKAQSSQQNPGADRAERVAELKAQVADGSYSPDLAKVAASLVQFLTERK